MLPDGGLSEEGGFSSSVVSSSSLALAVAVVSEKVQLQAAGKLP